MNAKLPVMAIFLEALSFPFRYFKAIFKVSFPSCVGVVALIASYFFFISSQEIISIAFLAISVVFFSVTCAISVVGCHRIFLLGDKVVAETRWFNWTGNELKYIGWGLILTLCMIAISIPYIAVVSFALSDFSGSSVFMMIMMPLIGLPLFYMMSRWMLIFPAASLGQRGQGLSWSWELSVGNGWRLVVLIMFLPLLVEVLTAILSYALGVIMSPLIISLLVLPIKMFMAIVGIGVLSLSYQYLVDNQGEEEDSSEPDDESPQIQAE